jgi:acetyl esterase/lipase
MQTSKITKSDFDIELQDSYRKGKIIVSFKYHKWKTKLFNFLTDKSFQNKKREDVITDKISIKSNHGDHRIPLVVYKPENIEKPLPIMLYMHGGGYVSGSPEMTPGLEDFIKKRPCIIVAPKYRRSLEAPYPAGFNDCYDTLLWIKENANSINGMNKNIIIAGHSAGGGLAAAVTLKNRDENDITISFQMPLYPMLDYRKNTESTLICTETPIWNRKSNEICWNYYLKGLKDKGVKIPSYASPALNTDYSGFPPTISFVGELEPFRDEVIQYMENIKEYDIPTKFQIFPKAYHGFESVVPEANISKKAQKFLINSYAEFYDKYCLHKK